MRDVVVILAYWRPNYIDLCLEWLSKCDGIDDKEVWAFQDDRSELPSNRRQMQFETSRKLAEGLQRFSRSRFVIRPPHDFSRTTGPDQRHSCSFNSFWALREAYEAGAPYIYLIHDDIMVTRDFFRWSEAVHNDGDYFSTVAERAWRENPWRGEISPSAYYRAQTNLMDGGMCWKHDNLGKLLHYPSKEVVDHRFPPVDFTASCPMIPTMQRAYHVGRLSSYALTDEFSERGDVDEIPPFSSQRYLWDKVRLVS